MFKVVNYGNIFDAVSKCGKVTEEDFNELYTLYETEKSLQELIEEWFGE